MDTRPDDRRDSRKPEHPFHRRSAAASRPAAGGTRYRDDDAHQRAGDPATQDMRDVQAQVVVMLERVRARAAADAAATQAPLSPHDAARPEAGAGGAPPAPFPAAGEGSPDAAGSPNDGRARAATIVGKLRIVGSAVERSAVIQAISETDTALVVSFVNAHGFNLAWRDAAFHRCLMEADLLLRDGVGMSMLMKLLGGSGGVNMNGTDLIPELLKQRAHDVALFGTRDPYLDGAARRLAEQGVDVKVMVDGFQPEQAYVDALREHHPALVVLAMGMPKQERVAYLLKQQADWPCVIVNGGAILDFVSGRVRRAPRIVRALQFEWAYRLAIEPRRLGRRYVVGNLMFIARALQLNRWLRLRRATEAKLAHDAAHEVGTRGAVEHWPR